jgi:hypothetical protein
MINYNKLQHECSLCIHDLIQLDEEHETQIPMPPRKRSDEIKTVIVKSNIIHRRVQDPR